MDGGDGGCGNACYDIDGGGGNSGEGDRGQTCPYLWWLPSSWSEVVCTCSPMSVRYGPLLRRYVAGSHWSAVAMTPRSSTSVRGGGGGGG